MFNALEVHSEKKCYTDKIWTLVLCYFDHQYGGMSRQSPQSVTESKILTFQKVKYVFKK